MYIDLLLKEKLRIKYNDEQVLVIPYSDLNHISDKFNTMTQYQHDRIHSLANGKGKFVFRYDAEYNNALQQLIPYVLITNVTGTKYFVSKRISGDTRLKDTYSIGFGGHINPIDWQSAGSVINNSINREINEEVNVALSKKTKVIPLGTVRDLKSETSDHTGIVYVMNVRSAKIKEKDSLIGYWMTLEDLVNNYFRFEGWAKYIIDHLYIQKTQLS